MKEDFNLNRSIFVWACGVAAVLFGFIFYLTPIYNDDVWFLGNSVGERGSLIHLQTTVANAIDHWNFDTGRLSNLSGAIALSLFPDWLYATLSGLAIWYILIIGCKFSGCAPFSPGSAFWIFTVVFIFPWLDYLFGVIYSANYLWSVFFAFLLMRCIIHPSPFLVRERNKIANAIIIFILSLIVGWWHEGLSVLLISGMIIFRIFYRTPQCGRVRMNWSILGLVCGLLILFSLPAFRNQVGERHSQLLKSVWWESAVNILVWNCLYYLYLLLFIIAVCRRTIRNRLITNGKFGLALNLAFLGAGGVSTLIYLIYFNGPRTGAFCQILSAIAILRLLPYMGVNDWLIYACKRRWIIAVLVLTASYINLGYSIMVQKRLTREYNDVMVLAAKAGGENPEVYYDVTPIRFGIDLLKPSYNALNTTYGLRGINLLPSVLVNFSFDNPEVRKCSGDHLYLYKDKIIMRGIFPEDRFDVELTLENGDRIRSRTRTRIFHTGDGEKVVYVLPHSQALQTLKLRDVKKVDSGKMRKD